MRERIPHFIGHGKRNVCVFLRIFRVMLVYFTTSFANNFQISDDRILNQLVIQKGDFINVVNITLYAGNRL